ncbi:MAG TPA: DNA-3-methyladenine glycosylase [Egicoccus sp.]|nr:DNA-3-methyladenine glycosylase [Egicoccus sp.]HSK23518.1 DNA-3-methyladenine glycosylase [Egicoccus sp.]
MTDHVRRIGADLEPFPREALAVDAPTAAVALLGAVLRRRELDGSWTLVRIVETEAYRQDDPASHSAAGLTGRTAPMFSQAGTAYVYRSYGIHWCLNVTAEAPGIGAAALIRAAVALNGHELLRRRRPAARTDRELLRGPGRLCQALDVDAPRHDGRDLLDGDADLQLSTDGYRLDTEQVLTGPRTGVRLAADVPWRFALAGVPEVSPYRRHPSALGR